MHIDWASLVAVGVVSAAGALAVVLLISLAVVNVSARARQRRDLSHPGPSHARVADVLPSDVGAAAALCVLAAGLIVGYGVFLMVA